MMNKRELLAQVFDGKAGDRVPIGFWWHFLEGKNHASGFYDNDLLERSIAGHKAVLEKFSPDIMKIMTDGFFCHPSLVENDVRRVEDLKKVQHITRDHPWVQKQIKLANSITELTGGQVMVLYNLFSAVQQLRLYVEYISGDKGGFRPMIIENTEETMKAVRIIEEDTNMLLDELKANTAIDGIYYSVQQLQFPEADEEFRAKWNIPSDLAIMKHINELWKYNMVHICGDENHHNDVKIFRQYNCSAYNWATHADRVSIKEGKEIFHTCVCGGFDNNPGSIITDGSIEELKAYTKKLIAEAGPEGFILGADCTIPGGTPMERLEAIREAAIL